MHNNQNVINLLKTIRGQVEGIITMVEDNRYCVDVSNQILSIQALLRKVNLSIIDNHIRGCVKDAIETENYDEKLIEVMDILSKYAK